MATVERREILDMLAQGKISAAEAAELLNQAKAETPPDPPKPPQPAVSESPPAPEKTPEKQPEPAAPAASKSHGWFRVHVQHLDTGKNKVTVNIPLPLLKFGLKIGRRFTPELDDLDLDELEQLIEETTDGLLVDVRDEDDNEHVRIFID